MVIWIIGLSGSGKTYLAKKIFSNLKEKKKIIVDGDIVRKYITYNLKYSKEDRKKNATLISDLCKFLEFQGFVVICSILSIYHEHQRLNRLKYDKYFQIYLPIKISKLKERNNKNIYSKNNVVGTEINFPVPYKSDLIIKNNFKPYSKNQINKIISKIKNVKTTKKKN